MKIVAFHGARAPRHEVHVVRVYEDGHSDALPLHLEVANKSPTGFEWGYSGSGPAQLALAVCCELVGPERAEIVYQRVKEAIFAPLTAGEWQLGADYLLMVIEKFEARIAEGDSSGASAP